ncbi:sigma 54-interacting transcriptional regulator [Candidatus Magnetobacterium casense]|uniref:Sigma-54-dependent Fis family transcriptional regulator n=1 Tax=Candidatus Magnetobacterium casense TaxID=1455061 RepID=A0ABS6RYB9_9BACT|nr:sigma-54 dependent transcriptional regulator [Candidatus Magnetobacterium casensis]MBV6341642.1 sigma-54-dependent Fis family transcriptional regulator [Candidatus Magnetobacterium casensis]
MRTINTHATDVGISYGTEGKWTYDLSRRGITLSVSDGQENYISQQGRELINNQLLYSKNAEMQKVIEKITLVAGTDFSVIIQGETGTGKTMIARLLHTFSKRSSRPFVHVDINAVPESLIETELFGYEKGSFTGAYKRKKGFFESADGGTIFLDDIQNLSGKVQGKILSVVEEKRFYPIGTAKATHVDVRLVVATNVDISVSLMDRTMRDDLFYRLGEFFITVPPLRNRQEDIPALFSGFVTDAGIELNRNIVDISEDVFIILKQHHWPGNIRELKNVARRATLVCTTERLLPQHIEMLSQKSVATVESLPIPPLKTSTAEVVRQTESKAIKEALAFTGGNKKKAAALLKIDYKTLITKIKDYGLK